MNKRKKCLICTFIISLACIGLLLESKITIAQAVDKVTDSEVSPQLNTLAVKSQEINCLSNPTFKRGKNSNNQEVISDWNLYRNVASMNSNQDEMVIGTDVMGEEDNYNKLIPINNQGNADRGGIGLIKTDSGKLEANVVGNNVLIVAQTITTVPGRTYTFSADTWSNKASKRGISIYNGTAVAGSGGEAYITNEEGDQKISASFVAKSAQTTISIRLYAGNDEDVCANMSNLEVIEEKPWVSEYSKWLNSMTNIIPKTNTFLLRETEDTEIVESVGLSRNPENTSKYIYDSEEPNIPRSIKFKNVGYYEGESINVRVTLTPNFNPKKENNYIGVKGNLFLRIGLVAKIGGKVDVRFEFFDQKDQPIALSGYWNFSNLNNLKTIAIPTEQIEHVYSVDRQHTPPIGINYTIEEQNLILSGQVSGTSDTSADRQLSVTYSGQTDFSYSIITNQNDGIYVVYPTEPIVKVAIPDPQGIEQKVTEITPLNEAELNYQFVQQIPYQTPTNRDQSMKWTLKSPTVIQALNAGAWVVKDEAGVDRTDLFTFDVDDLGNGTVTPTNLSENNLYNHYFLFQRKLLFSGNEVEDKNLVDKENGRYLDYAGNIDLTVANFPPVKTAFSTSINFASTIDYHYLMTGTQIPVPGSELQPKQVKSLITHQYPIKQSPLLEDYRLISQEPENIETAKVRYTKEQVAFNYEFVAGSMDLSVPKTLAFHEASISTSKQAKVSRVEPDWMLKVTDQRAKSLRNQWQVTAKLKEPFTNAQEQTLSSVLKFKAGADKTEYTLDTSNSVPIYQSEKTPEKVIDQEIRWADDAGFYLDFEAFGYYPSGDYKSVIEFSLESVPTS